MGVIFLKYVLNYKPDEQKGIVIPKEILKKLCINNNCQYEVDGDQNFLILKIVRDNEKEIDRVNLQVQALKELNGLLMDENISRVRDFEAILADRVNISRDDLEL